MIADGHWIVDMQMMIELAMSPALTVHVTVLLPVTTVTPLFSIDSETLMMPQTCVTEHVYVTLSLAAADDLSTTHVGEKATICKVKKQKNIFIHSNTH